MNCRWNSWEIIGLGYVIIKASVENMWNYSKNYNIFLIFLNTEADDMLVYHVLRTSNTDKGNYRCTSTHTWLHACSFLILHLDDDVETYGNSSLHSFIGQ